MLALTNIFYLFITLTPFPPEKLRPIALLVFPRVMGDHIQNWPQHASKFCRVTQLMRLSGSQDNGRAAYYSNHKSDTAGAKTDTLI